MSSCQIRFLYNKEDVVIKCQRNELMRNIIIRYGIEARLSIEELCFFYNGYKINLDLNLDQVNDKDIEILINVEQSENVKNEDKSQKLNYIKCPQCFDEVIVEFSKDYEIILSDTKHTKKIKLKDYNNT